MSKQITLEEKEEIKRLYVKEHLAIRKIGQVVHRGDDTILNVLKEYGVYKNKKAKPTEEEEKEIVRLHVEEGLSIKKIQERMHRGQKTISDILEKYDVKRAKHISEKEEKQIVELYKQGMGQREIASKMKRNTGTIKDTLIKYGVHKTIQETNISKYAINQDFFDVNNQTYNSAYVMGLIAADGWISRVDNQICIELQRSDKELLEKVNLALENEREVKDYVTGRGYENSKLYFYSRKMKEDLNKFNLVPNKTYDKNYKRPNLLKPEFEMAFLRGMFDGDGSITMVQKSKVPKWQIDTSNEDVALWILEVFKKHNMNLCHNYNDKVNVILHRCNTARKEYIREIYDLFYNNPNEINPIYMERKKKRFEEIMPIMK